MLERFAAVLVRYPRTWAVEKVRSGREAIARLLSRGYTCSEVGDRLGVSVHTVESHVKNIYRKLEVHSARAAVWRAMELRLFGEQDTLQLASHEVS